MGKEWTESDRLLLFWGGCMPVRAGIAYAASQASPETLVKMGYFAFIPALLFLIVWATGARRDKGGFGGVVWWDWTRPIHALLILTFAIMAVQGNPAAWKVLAVDTALGASFFTAHRQGLV